MEAIKKYFKPLMLLGIMLLAVGCTNTNTEEAGTQLEESGSEHNIRMFLNGLLNGPNEEQEQLIEGPDGDLKTFIEKFDQYNEEHFKPYVSERFFKGFLNTNQTFVFLRIANGNDYELKAEEITFEEKENYYQFTVQVSYTKNKSKESKTLNVKGNAQTNEEDKVTSVQFINFEEFRAAMEKD